MKLQKNQEDFFDYEAKYSDNHKIKEIFPEIEPNLKNKFEIICKKIYTFFNIKNICRIDFLVRNWEIYFLEINTIPWMTDASILPKSWKLTWRSSKELVKEFLK